MKLADYIKVIKYANELKEIVSEEIQRRAKELMKEYGYDYPHALDIAQAEAEYQRAKLILQQEMQKPRPSLGGSMLKGTLLGSIAGALLGAGLGLATKGGGAGTATGALLGAGIGAIPGLIYGTHPYWSLWGARDRAVEARTLLNTAIRLGPYERARLTAEQRKIELQKRLLENQENQQRNQLLYQRLTEK